MVQATLLYLESKGPLWHLCSIICGYLTHCRVDVFPLASDGAMQPGVCWGNEGASVPLGSHYSAGAWRAGPGLGWLPAV